MTFKPINIEGLILIQTYTIMKYTIIWLLARNFGSSYGRILSSPPPPSPPTMYAPDGASASSILPLIGGLLGS